MLIPGTDGQGIKQFLEIGAAFLFSAAIGLEREIRHKSAGLRTETVVGTGCCPFYADLQVRLHECSRGWPCCS